MAVLLPGRACRAWWRLLAGFRAAVALRAERALGGAPCVLCAAGRPLRAALGFGAAAEAGVLCGGSVVVLFIDMLRMR